MDHVPDQTADHVDARPRQLAAGEQHLAEARGQLSAEVARFEIARSEFFVAAAEEKDRFRACWAALEKQQQRLAAERAEAHEFFANQEAALDARAADVAAREQAVARARAALDRESAGLRAEAAGLETRIQNARGVVAELEQTRDRLRAELLGPLAPADRTPPAELAVALDRAADRDLTTFAAELDARADHLAREKARVAAVQAVVEREYAELADRRRVLAEQFVMLADARARWQETERTTLTEMEDLARTLDRREQDLTAREERLVRADARRREEGYELWQLRLRLEAWQSKLTAADRRWHAEREARDAGYDRRFRALAQREAELEDRFSKWERVRDVERERLRSELRFWADDRARLAAAAAEYDRQAREVLGELVTHAARALASEQVLAESVPGSGSGRARRRFRVMQKRWEQVFRRKRDAIEARRAAAAADFARQDERYRELHRLLAEVVEREGELNAAASRADALPPWEPAATADAAAGSGAVTAELAALRDEFERLATVLIEAGVPDPPDGELPWAAEEADAGPADVLPFAPPRAA